MTNGEAQENARTQLVAAIKASGLSARQYFKTVLMRNERSGRRWVAGDSPIPREVIKFLEGSQTRAKGGKGSD